MASYLVGVRQFTAFLQPHGRELTEATRADLEAFIAGLWATDIDFDLDVALVLGKGRRERPLPFGRTTAVALDSSLRPSPA